jgi:6-phosphogluconolactonase
VVDALEPVVRVHADPVSAARAAAERLAALASDRRARGERFRLAVSGGRTPEPMFRALADPPGGPERWRDWDVFWCDERLVPPTDPRSNFGLARRLWLGPAGVPTGNVHPVDTTLSLEAAAQDYETALRAFFGGAPATTFDVVVLGVGPDGHTASLFPGAASLRARERWVAGEPRPRQPPRVPRVTLTLAGLALARHALFLACGAEKRPVLAKLLDRTSAGPRAPALPAGRVRGVETTEWYLDRDATPFP